MPTTRADEPDPDNMADILYPMFSSSSPDTTGWSNSFGAAQGYESSWRSQGPSQYTSPNNMSQTNLTHDQAWSSYNVSPVAAGFSQQHSSSDLFDTGLSHMSNEAVSLEHMQSSTGSSSTSLQGSYPSGNFFSAHDTFSSDPRPARSSVSSSTSAALASAAALRNREQASFFPDSHGDSIRHRSYQPSQPTPQRREQRSASLKVPSTIAPQGIERASRSNSTSSAQLQDEERLLLHLKEEEALSWKEIAQRFQSELGISYQIPALQMRYKRLKEKIRIWSNSDLEALRQARDYWETKKWEIISNKMLDFGASEKFSVEACKRKLNELESGTLIESNIEPVASARTASSGAASASASRPATAMPHERSQTDPQQWSLPQWHP